ncbi:MAG TPA: MFS transporter [Streptosporangiaceae bacterium]
MNLGPEYRRIWAGSAASNLADGATFVALPLLAVSLTGNPAEIAGLSAAYALPRLLAVLGIGVLVDRLDRRRLLCLASFSRVLIFAGLTALVLAKVTPLAARPAGYGFLLSFSAVGGLLGSVVASRLRSRVGYGWSVVAALAVGALSFGAIALTSDVWLVAVALAAYICHSVVWNVMAASIRQKVTPTAMMGRVGSVSRLAGLCGLAAGAGLGGLLASHLGFQAPFAVAAAFFLAAAMLAVLAMRHFTALERGEETLTAGQADAGAVAR